MSEIILEKAGREQKNQWCKRVCEITKMNINYIQQIKKNTELCPKWANIGCSEALSTATGCQPSLPCVCSRGMMGAVWEWQSSASRELWESSCLRVLGFANLRVRELSGEDGEDGDHSGKFWVSSEAMATQLLKGRSRNIYILKGTFKKFNADETWPWSFRMGASHALEQDPRCLHWDRHSLRGCIAGRSGNRGEGWAARAVKSFWGCQGSGFLLTGKKRFQ